MIYIIYWSKPLLIQSVLNLDQKKGLSSAVVSVVEDNFTNPMLSQVLDLV